MKTLSRTRYFFLYFVKCFICSSVCSPRSSETLLGLHHGLSSCSSSRFEHPIYLCLTFTSTIRGYRNSGYGKHANKIIYIRYRNFNCVSREQTLSLRSRGAVVGSIWPRLLSSNIDFNIGIKTRDRGATSWVKMCVR